MTCFMGAQLLSTHADRQSVDISVTVCVFFVCTVTDFIAEDKASGVKFSTAVLWRPWQEISHFEELCSPRSPKSDESPRTNHRVARAMAAQRAWAAMARATIACSRATRRIGMCGYTAVPEDGRTCSPVGGSVLFCVRRRFR